MPRKTIPVNQILGPGEVLAMCGTTSRRTLARWRAEHAFPQPIRTLDAVELWDARDVQAWLERAEFRRRRK